MRVFVFGNEFVKEDSKAINFLKKIDGKLNSVEFIIVNPNQDLPFEGEEKIVILDTVEGIDKVEIFNEQQIDKIKLNKSVTVHDFDLGLQLKYLKKIGRLKKFTIIGIPKNKKVNYLRIQSILRKLVAQDMQGS